MISIDVAAIFLIIFVSMEIGREFQNKSIQVYTCLIPNRRKYFISKLMTYLFISVVTGIIVGLLSMGSGYLTINMFNKPYPPAYKVIRFFFGCIFMPVTYTILATCSSFFFRNTACGILVPFLIMFLPSIIKLFPNDLQAVLINIIPAAAIHSLSGVAIGQENVGVVVAVLVLVMWCIIAGIISVKRFKMKDIDN